ncbi:hypothetical protein IMG5_097410 [Ichthyophthirius multifiliis]|uniref:Uncharacterized protein n=1 Tax=Ichthyophthirius multifiliis TaxID=5932 RepID=G0QRT1_ICHMU|nr:hypothetical protein IMG5_097410 [Ichthyophthirius multifiliis]EGR32065.1 hypothetical protein IMG5_097410 [Ichthyophthirius multifiliis]|eukprot:XP_004035551.1 hypothetical protein IMG5_097410 [Ichthyophthirius multifiliis]
MLIICSVFYWAIMDILTIETQVVDKQNIISEKPIVQTIVVNNNVKAQIVPIQNTKYEMLTGILKREDLQTFLNQNSNWFDSFKEKINIFAQSVRTITDVYRKELLSVRKEAMMEKASLMQTVIPQKYRNGKNQQKIQ